jgi:hypothetical protein
MKVRYRGPGLASVTCQSVLGGLLSLVPSPTFSRTVGKLWANIFATSKLEITSTHRGGASKSEEMDERGGGTAGKRKHDMSLISVLQCVNTRACTEYCTEKPS